MTRARTRSHHLDPEERIKPYIRIARDIVLVVLAVYIFLHETKSDSPDPVLIGAGLVMLGLPTTLRLFQHGDDDEENQAA